MGGNKTASYFMCIASELKYYLMSFPCHTCQKLSICSGLAVHKLKSVQNPTVLSLYFMYLHSINLMNNILIFISY